MRVLTNLVSNATKTVAANDHIDMGARDTNRAINLRTLALVLHFNVGKTLFA